MDPTLSLMLGIRQQSGNDQSTSNDGASQEFKLPLTRTEPFKRYRLKRNYVALKPHKIWIYAPPASNDKLPG